MLKESSSGIQFTATHSDGDAGVVLYEEKLVAKIRAIEEHLQELSISAAASRHSADDTRYCATAAGVRGAIFQDIARPKSLSVPPAGQSGELVEGAGLTPDSGGAVAALPLLPSTQIVEDPEADWHSLVKKLCVRDNVDAEGAAYERGRIAAILKATQEDCLRELTALRQYGTGVQPSIRSSEEELQTGEELAPAPQTLDDIEPGSLADLEHRLALSRLHLDEIRDDIAEVVARLESYQQRFLAFGYEVTCSDPVARSIAFDNLKRGQAELAALRADERREKAYFKQLFNVFVERLSQPQQAEPVEQQSARPLLKKDQHKARKALSPLPLRPRTETVAKSRRIARSPGYYVRPRVILPAAFDGAHFEPSFTGSCVPLPSGLPEPPPAVDGEDAGGSAASSDGGAEGDVMEPSKTAEDGTGDAPKVASSESKQPAKPRSSRRKKNKNQTNNITTSTVTHRLPTTEWFGDSDSEPEDQIGPPSPIDVRPPSLPPPSPVLNTSDFDSTPREGVLFTGSPVVHSCSNECEHIPEFVSEPLRQQRLAAARAKAQYEPIPESEKEPSNSILFGVVAAVDQAAVTLHAGLEDRPVAEPVDLVRALRVEVRRPFEVADAEALRKDVQSQFYHSSGVVSALESETLPNTAAATVQSAESENENEKQVGETVPIQPQMTASDHESAQEKLRLHQIPETREADRSATLQRRAERARLDALFEKSAALRISNFVNERLRAVEDARQVLEAEAARLTENI